MLLVILIKIYLIFDPNKYLALDHELKFKQALRLSFAICFVEYLVTSIYAYQNVIDDSNNISLATVPFGIINLVLIACAKLTFVLVNRRNKQESSVLGESIPRITEHNFRIL